MVEEWDLRMETRQGSLFGQIMSSSITVARHIGNSLDIEEGGLRAYNL